MEELRILIVSANPNDTSNIHAEKFFKTIKTAIDKSKKDDIHKVSYCAASSYEDFIYELQNFSPNIIHFVGHGDRIDRFAFEREDGEREMVWLENVNELLSTYSDTVKMVHFSSCHSYDSAKSLSYKIKYTLGWQGDADVDLALDFCKWFYFFSSKDSDFEKAYERSLTQIKNFNNSVALKLKPTLFLKPEIKDDDENTRHIKILVFTSNKTSLEKYMKKTYLKYLPKDRYHDLELKLWKPYSDQPSIEYLLDNVKNTDGYNFERYYINDMSQTSDLAAIIEANKRKSIVIIDLLALRDKGETLATRIDNPEVSGIILPECDKLNKKLRELMSNRRVQIFQYSESLFLNATFSLHYERTSVGRDFFERRLKNLSQIILLDIL